MSFNADTGRPSSAPAATEALRARPPRRLSYVVAGAALLGLSTVHLYVRARGLDYSGSLLILNHIYVIAVVGLLLGLCGAVGSWGLGRWAFGLDEPVEQLTFGIAVGAGLIATGILICGLLGQLELTMPLLLGYGILARRQVIALPLLLRGCVRQVIAGAHPAAIAVLVMVVVAMLILAVAPPTDYDSLMYHVQIPVRYLEEGRIFRLADNPHVAQIAIPHMLYLPLITLAGWSAPAVFSTLITALFGLSVFSYCSRFLGRSVASMALALIWGSPMLLLIGATARIDVTLAWLLVLAAYALSIAASERRSETLMLGAFLMGVAVGTKVLAIPFVLVMLPVILWAALRCAGGETGRIARLAFGFCALAVGAASPWLAKNTFLLSAPLAPVLTEERMDPWLSNLYEARKLSPDMTSLPPNALLEVRSKFNLRDFLFDPARLTPELEGVFYSLNPVVLLSLAFFMVPNWRWLLTLLVPGFAYPIILLTSYPYTNLRYLIPSIAFLTIIGIAVAVHVLGTMPRKARTAGYLLIILMCLAPTLHVVVARFRVTGALGVASGLKSPRDFLGFSEDPEIRQYYAITRLVNHAVPADGRVVLLFEGRGLYFAPSVLQDNLLRTWTFLRPIIVSGGCLEGSGITHVLVAEAVIEYYARRGMNLDQLGGNEFDRFARRCLIPLQPQPSGYALYRVRGPSRAP